MRRWVARPNAHGESLSTGGSAARNKILRLVQGGSSNRRGGGVIAGFDDLSQEKIPSNARSKRLGECGFLAERWR